MLENFKVKISNLDHSKYIIPMLWALGTALMASGFPRLLLSKQNSHQRSSPSVPTLEQKEDDRRSWQMDGTFPFSIFQECSMIGAPTLNPSSLVHGCKQQAHNTTTITENRAYSSAMYYHIARYFLHFPFDCLKSLREKSEIPRLCKHEQAEKQHFRQGMQKTSYHAVSHPPANHIFPSDLFKLVQNSYMGNVRTKQSWMNSTTQRSANTDSHYKWYSRKHSDSRALGKHISWDTFSQKHPSAWAVLVSQSGFLDTLHRAWQNNYQGAFQFKQHNFAFSLHLPTMCTHGSGYLPRRTLTTASSLSLQHIFNSFAILLRLSWVNKQKPSVNTNQLLLEEADTWP